jgi:hypothetical protein
MLPPIFATLKASQAVKDIVGSNPPRIYRHGAAPVDLAPGIPYVTWFVVSDVPENHLSGTPPTDRVVVQVDSWHTTDAGVVSLALAVRDALEPFAHMTGLVADLREVETKLYRMGLQFDWFHDRTEP